MGAESRGQADRERNRNNGCVKRRSSVRRRWPPAMAAPMLSAKNGERIRKSFGKAFEGKNDPVHRTRAGHRRVRWAVGKSRVRKQVAGNRARGVTIAQQRG